MIPTLVSFFIAIVALMLATKYRDQAAEAEKQIEGRQARINDLVRENATLIVTSNQQRDEIQALRALPKRNTKHTTRAKRRSSL